MELLSELKMDGADCRYIAEISTGHQRNGIDDIPGFFGL
jgi:hypothetical protein